MSTYPVVTPPGAKEPAQEQFPVNPWHRWGLRVLVFILLVGIYLGAVWIRTASFHARGHQHSDPFWVESAQHFRNVRMAAETGAIPEVDIDLEYPDGLNTRSHTIHGEWAIGLLGAGIPLEKIAAYCHSHGFLGVYLDQWLAPFWPVQEPTLSAFVRFFVRLSVSTLVFWFFFITVELTGSRTAGVFAALLYAFSFGGISRSLGDTFYHEHVALPLLGVHLWFFIRTLKRPSWMNPVLCTLFLIASLLTWKVIEFYFLVFMLYFFLVVLGPGLDRRSVRLLLLVVAGVLVTSLFLNVHLYYNRFYFSKGMLAAYAVLAAYLLQWKLGRRWKWSVIPLVFIFIGAKTVFAPDVERYNHVWLTFFYRFIYFTKPEDPSLLPFDVRHYWVPPYVSPNLFAFLNEVFWPVALAVPGVLATALYYLLPPQWREDRGSAQRRALAFLFLGFFCFLVFYLMFYKIKTFLLLFSIPWAGLWWRRSWRRQLGFLTGLDVGLCFLATYLVVYFGLRWMPGQPPAQGLEMVAGMGLVVLILWILGMVYRRTLPQRLGLAILIFFAVFSQGYQTVAWNQSWLAHAMKAAGLMQSHEKDTSRVVPGPEIGDLVEWAAEKSRPGEAFMCEFVMAPSILTYAHRPINQHCFFESDMREKYQEFSEALFLDEQGLYDFCRKYEASYFVYNAHILLRRDPNMSFRYIADAMGWNRDWAAYRMHFEPETLEHFELAHQNAFLRIYRVLPPEEIPQSGKNRNEPYSPVFDKAQFDRVMPDNPEGGVPPAEDFLYPLVEAYDHYYPAQAYLQAGDPASLEMGTQHLLRAIAAAPWATLFSNKLAEVYAKAGLEEEAARAYRHTLQYNPADARARWALGEE
jgi:hypothetical protein